MKIYADTSFLFPLYAVDVNSARADAWRLANPAPLPFTGFHRLEFRNALSLAVFQQRLTSTEVQAVWQEVENDVAAGLLVGRGGCGTVFWWRLKSLPLITRRLSVAAPWMSYMLPPPNFLALRNFAPSTYANLRWLVELGSLPFLYSASIMEYPKSAYR